MAPNIVIATHIPAMLEKVKIRLFHKRSGNTGSGARVSIQAKAIRRAAATEYRPMICQELHGY
jgi:hypothetical protein